MSIWRWMRIAGLGFLAALVASPAFADDTPLSVVLGKRTPALLNTLNLVAEGAGFMVSGEWWIALFPGLALMIAVAGAPTCPANEPAINPPIGAMPRKAIA